MTKSIAEMDLDELREMVRRYRRMTKSIGALLAPNHAFTHASGDALCPVCGLSLYRHPDQQGDTGNIVISCDGRRWKL